MIETYMLYVWDAKCRVSARDVVSILSLLLTLCAFAACSGATNSGADENSVSLDKISWCNKQIMMVFMDDQASMTPTASLQGTNIGTSGSITGTPVALKDWSTLKKYLGFSVFLPAELPSGSCLLSASGSIHNAVSGSNFTLTYLLPDQTSITIVQAPQHNKYTAFQCGAMPNISSPASNSAIQARGTPDSGVQLCSGAYGTTNITFSADWNKPKLQQFFQNLQPNVNWVPRS